VAGAADRVAADHPGGRAHVPGVVGWWGRCRSSWRALLVRRALLARWQPIILASAAGGAGAAGGRCWWGERCWRALLAGAAGGRTHVPGVVGQALLARWQPIILAGAADGVAADHPGGRAHVPGVVGWWGRCRAGAPTCHPGGRCYQGSSRSS
jgi:hypothetical protein